MAARPSSLSDAYRVLGVEQTSSIEQVKSAYKQAALRTHPDKNRGNEAATAEFQEISEAYSIILKQHERAQAPRRGFGSGNGRPGFSFSFGTPFGFNSFAGDSEDEDEEDDDYDYDEEYARERRQEFYFFLYEEFIRAENHGRRSTHSSTHSRFYRPRRPSPDPETPEEYQARIRRTHEEQVAAAERRTREAAERKCRQEKERERERREAEERQRAKIENKKAQAEASRLRAEKAVRDRHERAQMLRSAVFAAARSGDAAKVRKGIWEDEVDAAGGEIKYGCETVTQAVKDTKETLLHIAAKNGDSTLVAWLDAHSADLEERDSQGLTPLHVALKHGHLSILQQLFESYPPKESENKAIYNPPPSKSLLSLAVESCDPEIVWMILHSDLASIQDISDAWSWVTSNGGKASVVKKVGKKPTEVDEENFSDIRTLLMRAGGFTPPPTPKVGTKEDTKWEAKDAIPPSPIQDQPQPRMRKQKKKQKEQPQSVDQPRTPLEQLPPRSDANSTSAQHQPKSSNHGRSARGRGKGRGRS